ncbi:lantibiotic dehydratase [Lentzea pudingi]|uniref:Lantibiotic dehydratase n=1 Tax=Lentzea pudingi TaxID=1789439 RepID=A0ABQ2HD70_9PSEU|nr:lantibiotic dehydratase family protein [Lentzea pudingi]GGM73542.1 lantibiotic dehydratase [Lentzea pudingi]
MTRPEAAVALRWRLSPRLLLRRAGFGIHWWLDLAHRQTAERASEYRDRTAALERARAVLLPQLVDAVSRAAETEDKPALRVLSKARRALGRRGELGPASLPELREPMAAYQAAWLAAHRSAELLAAAVTAESADRDRRLRPLLGDERVRDALLQLAPAFHAEVLRWCATAGPKAVRAKDRAFQRRAYLYAQRLAVKNETTSFFGPLVHGKVSDEVTGILLGGETPAGVREVEAFVAFWAVCALAEAIAADPAMADLVPPSWLPSCRRDASTVRFADGRAVRLTDDQAALVAAIDGERTVGVLADLAGVDLVAARTLLAKLARAGAVRRAPEPPSTTSRPLEWLIGWAGRHAAHTSWPTALTDVRQLADRYAHAADHATRASRLADLEDRFTGLAGVDARRAAGRMYADRAVVSIDARGDQTPVLVGTDTARRWAGQLSPVLAVASHHGELRTLAANQWCGELMRGDAEMPYDELIRRVQNAPEERLAELEKPARQFAESYRELVLSGVDPADPRQSVLTPESVLALCPPPSRPAFVSPDVLLEHGRDEDLIVLGELHPYVFAWGSQGHFSDDPDGLAADFTADLSPWGGPGRLATVIRRRRHKGLVSDTFPGRFIEVTAVATDDATRSVPLSAVTVVLAENGPRLHDSDGELVLYAGEDDHPHLRAFAAPSASLPTVWIAGQAPRVRVGDLIAQRARWACRAADLDIAPQHGTTEIFLAAQRLRTTRGLPRFCFAALPHEPKPIAVDLDNPLAVEVLAALLRAGQADEFTLAEMRPAPDSLWLEHHGRPTTSEFRIALTGGVR